MADASKRTRNLIIGAVAVVLVIGVGVAALAASKNDSNGTGMASPLPADGYFTTLPVGAALPTDAECRRACTARGGSRAVTTRPRTTPNPHSPSRWRTILAYNAEFQAKYKPRVTGDFTGTTDEIIQWGACKWGLSDNMVRAQAVDESKWHQNTESDPEPRSSGNCPPKTTDDPCPTSFGILQIKWYFHPSKSATGSSYPMSKDMTAFSLDYTLSEERGCYDGLSFVGNKAKGDLLGCMGIWYAGDFRTASAEQYIARVEKNARDKVWLKWRGQVPS